MIKAAPAPLRAAVEAGKLSRAAFADVAANSAFVTINTSEMLAPFMGKALEDLRKIDKVPTTASPVGCCLTPSPRSTRWRCCTSRARRRSSPACWWDARRP